MPEEARIAVGGPMPTLLESTVPRFQFRNHHARWIDASPDDVWAALTSVRLDDLAVTKPLVAIRYLGASRPSDEPLFERGPLTMLVVDAPRYAVGGSIARPWKLEPEHHSIATLEDFRDFEEPGWAKYLTDFRLTPTGGGTLLQTETRGRCTDAWAWRRFRIYWTAIRAGSDLVRRDMLRTVADRVERGDDRAPK